MTSDHITARQHLLDELRLDLVGPSDPEDELVEAPTTRYLCGLLAPHGTGVDQAEDDELGTAAGDEEDEGPRASGPLSQSMTPSSIGISTLCAATVGELVVTASWGIYSRVRRDTAGEDAAGAARDDAPPSHGGRSSEVWRRRPQGAEVRIELDCGPDLSARRLVPEDEIWLEWLCRRVDDGIHVSLFLVNRREAESGDAALPPPDTWIFQPQLAVAGTDGRPFRSRTSSLEGTGDDPDLQSNALLYRDRREFATGHGTAVAWEDLDARGLEAGKISTRLVPDYELPSLTFDMFRDVPDSETPDLAMEALSGASSAAELQDRIDPLLDGYAGWLEARERECSTLPEGLAAVGRDNLEACRRALGRMRAGLALLGRDGNALEAFRLANEAMLLQRSHTTRALAYRRTGRREALRLAGSWRPFQLAFILLNLGGIVDPAHEDRMVGDLLWFPTGGGKTEAYLGLAAFTIFLRRLRGERDGLRADGGVTVLMRYTLRLLTIQQFQRAAALVCACEVLRDRAGGRLGRQHFRIGLWVGQSATPNSYSEAEEALESLRAGRKVWSGNPVQFVSCPWCGEALDHSDYWSEQHAQRTLVGCGNEDCDFARHRRREGLPVVVVDEEISRTCPTILLATVDKFAQMPFNGSVQALFGRVNRECPRHGFLPPSDDGHPARHNRAGRRRAVTIRSVPPFLPPELVIQDELHLISGPLGTLVGLYESAVDALASRVIGGRRIGPKVVASTATVRRAYSQVRALFLRKLEIFPPPGLAASDSFFAREVPPEQNPGRLYVGIHAPGKSIKTALVRVYARLLSAAAGLDESASDPYMTLVGYFKSSRELGGAVRLVEDDIPSRLHVLRRRGLPQRYVNKYEEMTGRVSSERIPLVLEMLEQPFPRDPEGLHPIDVLLATNMISVGVDVDRLGLMVVNGQPKTTAEYIQATSRVGRRFPGLVVTVYNWTRPRDISHYERFGNYHATLYRHVEANSVTPFSSRALDRGLAGVLVAACRLADDQLAPMRGAGRMSPSLVSITGAVDLLVDRAREIAGERTAGAVRSQLQGLLDEWGTYAGHQDLRYAWRGYGSPPEANDYLLRAADNPRGVGHWPAPGSLREVEPETDVIVQGLS